MIIILGLLHLKVYVEAASLHDVKDEHSVVLYVQLKEIFFFPLWVSINLVLEGL
jgi:hypothetical protein